MSTDQFREVEDKFFALKGQLEIGRLSREQFQAALENLGLQDALGRAWRLDPETGAWTVFDGVSWIQATPPSSEAERLPQPPLRSEADRLPPPPTRSEADAMPSPPCRVPQAQRGARGSRWLTCVILGGAFALVLAVLIGLFVIYPRGAENALDSEISRQVGSLVDSIDPDKPDTLYVPEDLIGLGRAAAPTLLEMIDSPKLTTRWAVVYYFSRMAQPEDIPVLANGLDDPNLSNRTTVAATLYNLGDYRGLSILQEAAQSNEHDAFTEPPQMLSTYARRVLGQNAPKKSTELPSVQSHGSGSGFLSAPLPVPNLDCDIKMSGCTANVTLNLQYVGDGARQDLADLWAAVIENVWESRYSANCCKLNITVNSVVGGEERAGYAKIIVFHIPNGQRHRPRATLGNSNNSNDLRGWWNDQDTDGFTAAHEAGHFLGIGDEYKDDENGVSQPVPVAAAEIGAGAGNIMAQNWPDAKGNLPSAKTRHINAVLKAYGLECPASCTDQCPGIRTPTPTRTATATSTSTPTRTRTGTPTSTPDISWIDPYVNGIGNQLVAQGHNPIAVALVTEDLRSCLINAVKGGMSREQALAHCAKELNRLPTLTPTATPTVTLTPVPTVAPAQPPPKPPPPPSDSGPPSSGGDGG